MGPGDGCCGHKSMRGGDGNLDLPRGWDGCSVGCGGVWLIGCMYIHRYMDTWMFSRWMDGWMDGRAERLVVTAWLHGGAQHIPFVVVVGLCGRVVSKMVVVQYMPY